MNERETKEIKIEEHTFVVKTYATAREAQQIQQAYFNGTKLEVVGDQPRISEFNPGIQNEVHKELIKQMVVTMDDSAESIVERALDLPNDQYESLVEQLDGLVAKKKK